LIALDADSAEPIDMIVSSPGGHLEDIERAHWLPAQEAIDYGLVGRIVKGREEL
jgi:ATP-dependent Clp protease protease subunit